jgi:4-amino-4-deoxy-L-arabinose transferase-like glycosyltransferase
MAWTAVLVATLAISYFSNLGVLGFVGPDEPRYAWIAREMAETGDWVTPRLYGRPWFEKPPLYYWSAALAFRLFGVSEAAARLPSAFAALLGTLALAWLAWRLYGAAAARWLLLILPSSVGIVGFSHAASTDMLFSATLVLALVAAATVLFLRVLPDDSGQGGWPAAASRGPFPTIALGFWLGLAVLAKGPAAVILLGGALFFWALLSKRSGDTLRLLHPAALGAFFLTALPWYIVCARRNPDFLRIFLVEHNVQRYLTPEFQHIEPFWYYGGVLVVAFLPWTALLLWALATGSAQLRSGWRIREETLLFLSWSAFTVLFFTLSQSKLPGYILPAIPVLALLIARQVATHLESRSLWLSALTMGLLLDLLVPVARKVAGDAAGATLVALGAGNLVLAIGLGFRRVGALLVPFAACPMLLAILLSGHLLPPFFHRDPSGKTLAEELAVRGITGQLAVQQMGRGQRYSLSFYLRQEIRAWDPEHPQEGYVLAGGNRLAVPQDFRELEYAEVPFDFDKTGFRLYQVKLSVRGAPGGGETK